MLSALVMAALALDAVPSATWPTIRPIHQMFEIRDASDPFVTALLHGLDGRPLYLFVCRGDEQTAQPKIIYSGTLDCRLMEASTGEVETNLLVEEENLAAWFSRGRMFPYELGGLCGDYPE